MYSFGGNTEEFKTLFPTWKEGQSLVVSQDQANEFFGPVFNGTTRYFLTQDSFHVWEGGHYEYGDLDHHLGWDEVLRYSAFVKTLDAVEPKMTEITKCREFSEVKKAVLAKVESLNLDELKALL